MFRVELDGIAVARIVTGRWRVNCYIVSKIGSGETMIIDPGDEADQICEALGERRPVRIILTHGHFDHLGAAADLAVRLGAECFVHEQDRELVRTASHYSLAFERRRIRLPTSLAPLRSGGALELGGANVAVIRTAGHTPGSVALRLGALLFTGDTLLRRATGRVDLPGGDARALHESVAHLLDITEDGVTIFPGHGEPWSSGEARDWWSLEVRG